MLSFPSTCSVTFSPQLRLKLKLKLDLASSLHENKFRVELNFRAEEEEEEDRTGALFNDFQAKKLVQLVQLGRAGLRLTWLGLSSVSAYSDARVRSSKPLKQPERAGLGQACSSRLEKKLEVDKSWLRLRLQQEPTREEKQS